MNSMNPSETAISSTLAALSEASEQAVDVVEAYFECITSCSLDDGECITVCTDLLREES